ncbi:MAG: NUDIX hydrolase [Deltaproteobacteria bacterium]|nr:NUDIX hydrolase [Deltaproteobacteria bacterium]
MTEKGDFFKKNWGSDGSDQTPRDAATVILLRECGEGPYELFLMRRGRNQAFMGGAYVFPGGRLDEADADPELMTCLGGFRAADARRLLQEPDLTDAVALGLFVAAIRETFEEAGVLLARDSDGNTVDLSAPERADRFAGYRLELHEKRMTLQEMARKEELCFAPDLLMPYAHWITPQVETRRFDTRFFLAKLPAGQEPVHDRIELTDSRWTTPDLALAEHAAGRIVLMPPTLKTVEELWTFPDAEGLMAATRSKPIPTILPDAFLTTDGFGIILPHDSEYSLPGRRPEPRPAGSTRIVLEGGIWRTRTV